MTTQNHFILDALRAVRVLPRPANAPIRKGYPNTFLDGGGDARPVVFDPALRHFPHALRAGDPRFADTDIARRWLAARRLVTGHVLHALADSAWAHYLVLRGSLLLRAWFGDAAREPGDIDFVVRPSELSVEGAAGRNLVRDLIRRASSPQPACGGVRILADQVRVDDIWTYERARGRRVVFPWEADGLPVGAVQCDLVFGEQLPVEASRVAIADGSGGAVSLWAAPRALSLAWKLLWLVTDCSPQGKDLFDAVLLAERTSLSAELLRRVFVDADCLKQLPARDDFPSDFDVDWVAFAAEYPHLTNDARCLPRRLADALRCRATTAVAVAADDACQTASASPSNPSEKSEKTMTALTRQPHVQVAELDRLLAALSDRRARVAHDACTVLAEDYVVPRDRLWALLATAGRAHTRTCVVRLLARGERLDSMTWLLNAVALGDGAVRDQACKHLARWGDVWPSVTPRQIVGFRVALVRASAALSAPLRERLWAFVNHVDGRTPRVGRAARVTATAKPVTRVAPQVTPRSAALRHVAGVGTLESLAQAVARKPPAPPLPGCVVLRWYELPPRRRAPWRWVLPRR